MIIRTPMGTVTSDNSSPSASSRFFLTTPRQSFSSASCRIPLANVCSFASVNLSRFTSCWSVPFLVAASRSMALASNSSSLWFRSSSAMVLRIDFRTSCGMDCNFRVWILASVAFRSASSDTPSLEAFSSSINSFLTMVSNSVPGVTKRVPFEDPSAGSNFAPKTDRMAFKSLPPTTTHALQFVPSLTANIAESIFDCIPPRPCALFEPIATDESLL
mmetsp:Transcript_27111/g.41602  ORF Transcript_27111/g.41602 Transcript_27111/m.41602 type:complete len:217 (-) Transcript_27111:835-1485(-)